nr:helix-turn-helix transcriptional regulator [Prevotella sp.]
METIKDRLVEYLSHLGIGQGKFEKAAGLGSGFVSKIKKNISTSSVSKIRECYPELNINWLLTGEGDMLTPVASIVDHAFQNAVKVLNIHDDPLIKEMGHSISYYPCVDGSMGNVQFLENGSETVQDIIIPGYSDCKFAINAYGDSMQPTIQSGQIVLLAPWTENFITWGRIYLVCTKSGYRTIKRLFEGKDDGKIECRSDNRESNPPFEISKDDITSMYIVKGWICRNEI